MLKTIALKFSVSSDYLLELDDRFIVDVTGLPMETVAHIQLIINDLKKSNSVNKD